MVPLAGVYVDSMQSAVSSAESRNIPVLTSNASTLKEPVGVKTRREGNRVKKHFYSNNFIVVLFGVVL